MFSNGIISMEQMEQFNQMTHTRDNPYLFSNQILNWTYQESENKQVVEIDAFCVRILLWPRTLFPSSNLVPWNNNKNCYSTDLVTVVQGDSLREWFQWNWPFLSFHLTMNSNSKPSSWCVLYHSSKNSRLNSNE